MRTLVSVPEHVVDPITGAVHFGSFLGGFPRVDLTRTAGPLLRTFARKRWLYVFIAKHPIAVAACVVDLGYSATAFAFAYDAEHKRMLADVTSLGMRAHVSDTAQEGCVAAFHSRALGVAIRREIGSPSYSLRVRHRDLDVHATMDTTHAPPSLCAVAEVGKGRVSTTEKRALLSCKGELRAGADTRSLDGALGAYDYTHGVLPRRTRWNWAFLSCTDDRGEPLALNLVQGFMGEPECAAFTKDGVVPLGEGRFEFDAQRPLSPWGVATRDEKASLQFSPGAAHQEKKNLGLVRSRFIQPVGTFSGTIDLGSRKARVTHGLGVVEDQDVLW